MVVTDQWEVQNSVVYGTVVNTELGGYGNMADTGCGGCRTVRSRTVGGYRTLVGTGLWWVWDCGWIQNNGGCGTDTGM